MSATFLQKSVNSQNSQSLQSITCSAKAKKLGFVRFWLVFMAISVVLNVLTLILFAENQPQLGLNDILVYVDVICSGVSVWLIVKRKQIARSFICVYCAAIVVIGLVGDVLINQNTIGWMLFVEHGRAIYIVCFSYFFTSRKVKQVLTVGFDGHTHIIESNNEHANFRPSTQEFWRNVVLYFIVFSVVGHWMEIAYGTFARYALGIYDPNAPMWQSSFAPFTIYGVGAIACILLLYPFKVYLDRRIERDFIVLALSFIANTLICTAIELFAGLALNVPDANGHLIYWDYSNIPFNLMGQICLQNALAFGMVATLMVWVLYPALERFILARPHDGVNMVFVATVVIYLLLAAVYIINPFLISLNLI